MKQRRTVLVVDDDLTMIKTAEKLLVQDGYRVLVASDGTSGIRKVKEEMPDLILLDVLMPDINGKDVARKLIEDPQTRDIPIIFMTVTIDLKNDRGNEVIDIDGRKCRAFAKPIHNRKILSVIRKSINRKIHNNT